MRVLPLAALPLAGLLLVAGCADADKAEKVAPPTTGPGGAPPSPAAQSSGAYSKEGWFGGADGLHARLDIRTVQRQAGKAVLRFSVTSLDTATKSVPFEIALVDPVGRRLYKPTGVTSGSGITPGSTREMAAEYPVIPADVAKVTAITPGTAGEFTGIPVTTGSASPSAVAPSAVAPSAVAPSSAAPSSSVPTSSAPSSAPSSRPPSVGVEPSVGAEPFGRSTPLSPSPSTTPTSSTTPSPSTTPTSSPSRGPGPNPADLYDIVEGETKGVTSSESNVTVNLRADVLFDTDSAKLSSRAKAVLDEAAQQIKAKASQALTFEGHTDSKGDDAHNLKLSEERAQAVVKEMKSRLGSGFTYTASGKGEAEPVAKEGGSDDAAARARNRRVEISYQVKQTTTQTTTASPERGSAAPSAPAPFRAEDGTKVASRYGRFGQAKRRIDVKPFYRDGAYIVAVFDIVNEGPGNTPTNAAYAHRDYPGGVFTAFSLQVPGGKDVYRAVRVGPGTPGSPSLYVDPGGAAFRTGVNQPVRGFAYIPAPPGKVTSVVFDAGPFGKVNNVPVR
ncbi:OmpA family protein [Actinomadura sp. NAK00032]|uniref:OmpA family protein n=1 Tax=Actinomadura sp. NAK00032 TaxID=2742128 RepID=UPI001591AC2E|nr:OmpA family protein [Actinomadura sp. NAK00032]QKW39642.1 OmpA family protein [Actinomadura sp. NAK00032]